MVKYATRSTDVGAVAAWLLLATMGGPSASVAPADEPDSWSSRLRASLRLGRAYLMQNQRDDGSLTYQVHSETGERSRRVDQVRQAGACWALALLHRHEPSDASGRAVRRALDYYARATRERDDGRLYVFVPGVERGATGTLALVTLAHLEYVQTESANDGPAEPDLPAAAQRLEGYLRMLRSLRRHDGRYYSAYDETGIGTGLPSPYFDGECLLTLVRAEVAGPPDPRRVTELLESAAVMHEVYLQKALEDGEDDPVAKGFFQWGIQADYVIAKAGWDRDGVLADQAVDLAVWMIDVHRTEERKANTAYAVEGLVRAAQLAAMRGRDDDRRRIEDVATRQLARLMQWQIGSPEAADWLKERRLHPRTVGGVLSAPQVPWIRVDTVQHQMRAAWLALEYVGERP